jgi:phosphoribosylamine--glycine ligase
LRVLLVGGGGREHALAWRIAESPGLTRLWAAPGNPGIAEHAECVAIAAEDVAGLVGFAAEQRVDLVVVGPEAPLTLGLADALAEAGIACFGPSAAAARLEGSKAFCREVTSAAGVPGAAWARFDDPAAARAHVRERGAPIVVKADGLAAGKGVVVAATVGEAEAAIADIMESRVHGESGATVVIEECLVGEEVSFFALCDGTAALPLAAAQDHKRVGDGDTGPNTGGMGATSPPPVFDAAMRDDVMARIIRPTLEEMARRGTPFRGVLFAGLMVTATGPRLIEFNVRFGDPECGAILLRLEGDLLAALDAACRGRLEEVALGWSADSSIVVVMAARGYPGAPARGGVIAGLDQAAAVPGVRVFHAGTARRGDGMLVAAGGRVLGIGARAGTPRAARDAAYAAVDAVAWEDGFCRRDIGGRAPGAAAVAARPDAT